MLTVGSAVETVTSVALAKDTAGRPVSAAPLIAGKAPVKLPAGILVMLAPSKSGAAVLSMSGVVIPVVPFSTILIRLPT